MLVLRLVLISCGIVTANRVSSASPRLSGGLYPCGVTYIYMYSTSFEKNKRKNPRASCFTPLLHTYQALEEAVAIYPPLTDGTHTVMIFFFPISSQFPNTCIWWSMVDILSPPTTDFVFAAPFARSCGLSIVSNTSCRNSNSRIQPPLPPSSTVQDSMPRLGYCAHKVSLYRRREPQEPP